MTMMFRTIKSRIVEILGDNAGTDFQVFGYQGRRQGAHNAKLDDRTVRVFYRRGEMSKRGSALTGPVVHEMTFDVEITTSAPASVNTTVLNDSSSTAAEKSTALAATRRASDIADEKLDEVMDLVYQILTDNRYQKLDNSEDLEGANDLAISDRWIDSMEKDIPSANGELVSITGALTYTVRAKEQLTGAAALATDVDGGGVDITIPSHDEDGNSDQDNFGYSVGE